MIDCLFYLLWQTGRQNTEHYVDAQKILYVTRHPASTDHKPNGKTKIQNQITVGQGQENYENPISPQICDSWVFLDHKCLVWLGEENMDLPEQQQQKRSLQQIFMDGWRCKEWKAPRSNKMSGLMVSMMVFVCHQLQVRLFSGSGSVQWWKMTLTDCSDFCCRIIT